MRKIFPILVTLTLFCSACSSPQEPIVEEVPSLEQQEAAENIIEPTREAVYIHNQNRSSQDNIILNTGGEPVQFGSGYIRLLGTACSRNSRFALIELSGQGMTVKTGDKVSQNYYVSYIKEREVKLCSRE